MTKSQLLRLCIIALEFGVNIVLAGCKSAPPPRAPAVIYDDTYWNARSCEGVDEPVVHNCNAAHARAGLATTATLPKFAPSREEAAQALDAMLAQSLKDPLSAIQYRVSDIRACDDVVLSTITRPAERGCLCFSVNAKNSYGGYTGGALAVARILQDGRDRTFIAEPTDRAAILPGIASCLLEPRDAAAIKAQIR
jgi:hypothetical protein